MPFLSPYSAVSALMHYFSLSPEESIERVNYDVLIPQYNVAVDKARTWRTRRWYCNHRLRKNPHCHRVGEVIN